MNFNRDADVTNDGTSVSTASISPTPGVPYFITVLSYGNVTPVVTGTNGWNVSWPLIGGDSNGEITIPGDAAFRLNCYIGIPSSSAAGVLTATGDGSTISICMHVIKTDASITGTIVQSEANALTATTPTTVNLNAFADVDNGTIFSAGWNGIQTRTEESPLTGLAVTNFFFGSWQLGTAWAPGNDTSPAIDHASNSDLCCIGAELNAGGGGGGGLPFITIIGGKRI